MRWREMGVPGSVKLPPRFEGLGMGVLGKRVDPVTVI
jgi:hypothetical protein